MRRFTLFICLLAVLAVSSITHAQQANRLTQSTSATVSVASLSVPDKAWKHYQKAKSLALMEDDAACRAEIAKALEVAPRFAQAYLLLGNRNNLARDYQASVRNILAAQAIDPAVAWAPTLLASAYNGLGRYEDAYKVLVNLYGAEADSWQAKYEMARAQVGRRDMEGALHWSELALAAAPPSFIDAHLLHANALQIASRWQEATKEFETYLASPGPQTHRAAVLAAVERTRQLAAQQSTDAANAPQTSTLRPDSFPRGTP